MPQPLIEVRHLSKRFARQGARTGGYGLRDIGRALLARAPAATLRASEFWSLRDVSFALAPGEALAVLGANGAGKSTLLKAIAGVLKPDAGEIRVRGRLSSLLDLGAGLEPLLTGRENIEQAAALYGFGAAATRAFTDRVIDFAELDAFIDARLQTYSTGMRARLGYALATQLNPDILLVDEVLAVGDMAFQRKCIDHMRRYLAGGGALLLVSHNPYQMQAVCDRGILLEQGSIAFAGSAIEAVHRLVRPSVGAASGADPAIGPARIEAVSLCGEGGAPLRPGATAHLVLRCHADAPLRLLWGFSLWSEDGWVCITSGWQLTPRAVEAGGFELRCTVPRLPLAGGVHLIRATLVDESTLQPIATFGHSGGGMPVEILCDPGLVTNAQLARGQLVEIDVEWD